MLYLFSGSPGSSKTLNIVKFISENEQFKNRPVYYYNVKDVTLKYKVENDNGEVTEKPWHELTKEQVEKWYELPPKSVIFIDECQRIFRPRQRSASVPKHTEELETHRHLGVDIICATQSPSLIDSAVLAQVERHTHIERKFQSEKAMHIVWQKAVKNVDSRTERQKAIATNVAFDKKYYGTYKSAVFHTPKRQIPKKVIIIIAFLLTVPVLFISYAIYMSKYRFKPDTPEPQLQQSLNQLQPSRSSVFNDSDTRPELDYYEMNQPRVEGMPWTAPKYDDILKPVSAPTPNACAHFKTRNLCVCYSWQGTRINVAPHICKAIVKGGYFDETRQRGDMRATGAHASAREPVRDVSPSHSSYKVIEHSTSEQFNPSRTRSYETGIVTRS